MNIFKRIQNLWEWSGCEPGVDEIGNYKHQEWGDRVTTVLKKRASIVDASDPLDIDLGD